MDYNEFVEKKERFKRNIEQLGSCDVIKKQYPQAYKNYYNEFAQFLADEMNCSLKELFYRKSDSETEILKDQTQRFSELISRINNEHVVSDVIHNFLNNNCDEDIIFQFLIDFRYAIEDIYIDYWTKMVVHAVHPDEALPKGAFDDDNGINPFEFRLKKDSFGQDYYWWDEKRLWITLNSDESNFGWNSGYLPPTKTDYQLLREARIEEQKKSKFHYNIMLQA